MAFSPLSFLRQRLAARRDTEHEQAFIRLAVGAVLGVYLFFTIEKHGLAFWLSLALFQATTFGILLSIILRPAASPVRRITGCAVDNLTATVFMIQSGLSGIILFVIYLWITIGNGFRYGGRYLLISLAFGMTGFTAVLAFSDFWRQHLEIGCALLAAMLVLSLYVHALVNRLSAALIRAEAANIAKRQFVSTISHEMRTPLNAIIGMSQLMHDTTLSDEQKEMLETIDSASHTMLELVDDVLDFSKIEAGKLRLREEDFNLHALINSAARILREQAEGKGLRFHVSIMPEVPAHVRGDPARLRQILLNLLTNAVKFTDQGEVVLHAALLLEADDKVKLKISVRDTGTGIAPELQKRIFESFTQVDQSVTRRHSGSGLGTTIAKQLVELMGGQIGLESTVGLGSTFWFELVLQKDAQHGEDHSDQENAGLPANPQGVVFISDYLKRKDIPRRLKILVADDNATNRLVLTRILERATHQVIAVNSGESALSALEQGHLDIVIFDRNMPGIGGVEALRALRVMEVGSPRTPALILSADVSEEAKQEALSAGADLYITKPVHSTDLLEAIASLVHKTSAEGDSHAGQAVAAALNYETLAHLQSLGSTDDFLDKLVHVFLQDNSALLKEMRDAAEAKRFNELRTLAHALKGSAVSVGLERLTSLCNELHKAGEGDLRMRGTAYIESIRNEFELARVALLTYLRKKDSRADGKQ